MNKLSVPAAAILGISIGLGIVIGSIFLADAIFSARATERYVTVKGLAEKEVDADLAIWAISFNEVGNDLITIQRLVDQRRETITDFLIGMGFERENVTYSAPTMYDNQASSYNTNTKYRYRVESTVTLQTSKIALVKEGVEQSGKLVGKGVVLSNSYGSGVTFLFTGLNDIKPDMIRQATINAREAASTFAEDSGSEVGEIRKASQGYFSITNRDENSPEKKIVRVVTTMEFFLE